MNSPSNLEPVPPFGERCTGYRHRTAWRILENHIERTDTGTHPTDQSTLVCLACAATWRQTDTTGIRPFSHHT